MSERIIWSRKKAIQQKLAEIGADNAVVHEHNDGIAITFVTKPSEEDLIKLDAVLPELSRTDEPKFQRIFKEDHGSTIGSGDKKAAKQ